MTSMTPSALIDLNDPIDPNDPNLEAAWGKRLLLPIMQHLSERVTRPGYTIIVCISSDASQNPIG